MNTPESALRSRNLRTVAALAALFVLPLLLSFWMYYGGSWQPATRTNHGELLQPVRPLPLDRWPEAQPLEQKWAMVYLAGTRCDERCRKALYVIRQTRLSLNQEMQRGEPRAHRRCGLLRWRVPAARARGTHLSRRHQPRRGRCAARLPSRPIARIPSIWVDPLGQSGDAP